MTEDTETVGHPPSPTEPRMVLAREREKEAVDLRIEGASFDLIAETLGYHDKSGARKAIMRALERYAPEPLEELRRLELARLDVAQAGIWDGVRDGDLEAVDTFLKISTRRARLLGLDAPASLRIIPEGLIEAEIRELEERLRQIGDDGNSGGDEAAPGEARGAAVAQIDAGPAQKGEPPTS